MRVRYSMNCHNSHDLFGCIGLRNAEYSILNKQYSKTDYEALIKKIRDHMDATPYIDAKGRRYPYGEFFPLEISPFAYNETLAQEYFPIDKNMAQDRGYAWKDSDVKNHAITKDASALPDAIADIPDSIVDEVIGCAHKGNCKDQCTMAFRILKEDLIMHRAASLPLPRLCPNCRHFKRLEQRIPMKLWHRQCACDYKVYDNIVAHPSHQEGRCPNDFETSYDPDRPEIVYCESCYNSEIL